ncbi:hypothetical protein [Ruegeria sp. B32]|uniref:hypothetical protein n=1 Tax=Ruegeria sp. B32 TaxID=2867020 RepID=UPI0021A89610|nr:hypothetical protein [Ruegeria sp. B32]UWR07328.1 hypothetical protein K3752_17200 [Ruegeria sp. B32]
MNRIWGHPVFWGLTATAVVVLFGSWIGAQEYCQLDGACKSKYHTFLSASPNEVGDTLAGFAGTLAFIWIIVTVWLQSLELAEQRKELAATRDELKLSREAHQQQVEVLRAQAEIFRDEQRSRRDHQAGKLLEERLRGLAERLVKKPKLLVEVDFERPDSSVQFSKFTLGTELADDQNTDVIIKHFNYELEDLSRTIENNETNGSKYTNQRFDVERVDEINELLKVIIEDFDTLSEADRQRVRNLHIVRSYTLFLDLLGLSVVHA